LFHHYFGSLVGIDAEKGQNRIRIESLQITKKEVFMTSLLVIRLGFGN